MTQPQQLSLSELDPDAIHGHGRVVWEIEGWRQQCACGWVSQFHETRRDAYLAVSAHLARTVQGVLVLKTLRKP